MAKLSEMKPNSKIKLLVYGDSGSGKTCFAAGFPGPIFVHDFDNKIVSAANFWREKSREQFNSIDYEEYNRADEKEAYATFNGWLVEAEASTKTGKFPWRTVVLDSLTLWSDLLMKEIQRQNPAIKGPAPKVPGMQHYGVFAVYFKDQINRFLALGAENIIVTAHIDIVKDENTGELLRRPLVAGKNATYLPIVFGEVWRAFAEIKDGKARYLAQTRSDHRFNCRTQISGLPETIELDQVSKLLFKPNQN